MKHFGAFVEKFGAFGFCRIERVSALGFGNLGIFGGVGFGGIEGGCAFGLGLLEGSRTFGLGFGGKLGSALFTLFSFLILGICFDETLFSDCLFPSLFYFSIFFKDFLVIFACLEVHCFRFSISSNAFFFRLFYF